MCADKKISFGGRCLWWLFRLVALVPRAVLYAISDFLSLFLYRVVRYRYGVIFSNIQRSFPEKSLKEQKRIVRNYYRYLVDLALETMMFSRFTEKEMQKYARITNPEVVEAIYAEGHHLTFVLMGHTGNWEWFSGSSVFFRDIDIYELYKPMKGAVEEVMLKNREHLGTRCLDKNRAPVSIISLNRNREHRSSVVFLADQTPSLPNAHLFAPFLGQTSAMFTGAERLARKLNIPMIFLDVRRKKRGVYEATFSVISKTPQDLPWGEATRRYMLGVQRRIEHQPEIWLWSHKRWKHTPESAASLLGEDAVTVFTDEINHVGDGEKQ